MSAKYSINCEQKVDPRRKIGIGTLILIALSSLSCISMYTRKEDLPREATFYAPEKQFTLRASEWWKKDPNASDADIEARIDAKYIGRTSKVIGECPANSEIYAIAEIDGYGFAFFRKPLADEMSQQNADEQRQMREDEKNESNLSAPNRALFSAVKSGDYEMMMTVISNGANVNAADRNGVTPLMLAAQRNADQMILFLLKKGARIDAQTKAKVTALMMAAGTGHYESTKILIARGAKVNLKDADGMTAYDMASLTQRNDIMLLLIAGGAKK